MTSRELIDLAQGLAPELEDMGAVLAMVSDVDDVVNVTWQLRSLLVKLEREIEPLLQ